MKKVKKIIRISIYVLIITSLISFISICLLLEPRIKISGFKTLDLQKLDRFNSEATFTTKDGDYLSEDVLVGTMFYVPISSVANDTVNAFVSAEDKRFFNHKGVDYIRIFGAFMQNLKHMKYKEGASTISQQLIKNTHLSSEKTINRKLQEIRIARQLERTYGKDEILEFYLNSLYFGNGIYGIGTASRVFFDKEVAALRTDESAALAGIINSPARYSPYSNYSDCILRRNLILARMHKNSFLTLNEYNESIDMVTDFKENNELFDHYFRNALFEASELLDCDLYEIKNRKYTINTYYDKELNKKIKEIYEGVEFSEKNDANLCTIILDNSNYEVVSIYGTGRYNYLNYRRSPGSTIKPLLSYTPAIEGGIVYPTSPILDQKISFNGYEPKNYKDKYLGWTSVEDSLAVSSNVAAVKLLDISGIEYSKNICKKMGLDFDESDTHLALALGALKNGLTLQQLANAYQTFPSGGVFKKCSYIKSIEDENGNIIYADKRLARRAIKTETAFLINNMLEKCVTDGTARRMKELKNVCAKTGTVGTKEGNTDAYCISYSKDYTVAVWIGAKSGIMPNSISGGTLATKINKRIMEEIKKDLCHVDKSFEMPEGIEKLSICKNIFDKEHKIVLANDMTPKEQTLEAYFDKNNMPKDYSLEGFNNFLLLKDSNVFFNKNDLHS